jgi:hypothetical protein
MEYYWLIRDFLTKIEILYVFVSMSLSESGIIGKKTD